MKQYICPPLKMMSGRMTNTITVKYDEMTGKEKKTSKVNCRIVKCVRRITLNALR